jgi:hypothetical protein
VRQFGAFQELLHQSGLADAATPADQYRPPGTSAAPAGLHRMQHVVQEAEFCPAADESIHEELPRMDSQESFLDETFFHASLANRFGPSVGVRSGAASS